MTAELLTDVSAAAAILRRGGLVAFATETVYGLGGNALDPAAVVKIFEAKQRPQFDPLIVHLADRDQLPEVASSVPEKAAKLMDHFWPGPLTFILPKQPFVPDLVTSGLPTVAVRVPGHPLARDLIRAAGVPLAAPSANLFGRISPTTAQHVLDQLGDHIDAVLDGGPCAVGIESTVIHCDPDGDVWLLRPGGITVEDIESVIGPLSGRAPTVLDQRTPQVSPGLLAQHYAPQKPLHILSEEEQPPASPHNGFLSLLPIESPEQFGRVEVLSQTGSLPEAAAGFFAALRRLDESDVVEIYAYRFPDRGLGRALNDRLQRAAGSSRDH